MTWWFDSKVSSTAIVTLLCCLCYWNSLDGDLVHDDIFAIRDNKDIRTDTPLLQLFSNDFWGKPIKDPTSHKSYRPLTVITFRINYALHGLDPWGYHFINVVLHMFCTCMVLWLCRSIVFPGLPQLSLQAACLFATHPVHTEAVSGVVGRADVLAGIFYIICFVLYHSCISDKMTLIWFTKLLGCLISGCCAMFCKEQGITVFGICICFDLFPILTTYNNSIYQIKKMLINWPFLVRFISVCLLTTLLMVFRVWVMDGTLPLFSSQDNPASFADSLLTRSLTYCYLYYFNAKLLLAPTTLCYDWQLHSIPLVESILDPRNICTVVFFIYLFSLCWYIMTTKEKTRLVVFLGIAFLVLPFLPASNLFFRVGFVVAERILYIPSIGMCILVVCGLHVLQTQFIRGQLASIQRVIRLLIVLIIVFFSVQTILRNPVWRSRETLFRSGIDTIPTNAKIHYNYANFLKDSGRTQEAISHYKTALKFSPDHSSAHNNLATLLSDREAEHHFKQAIKHNPQHFKAFFNLGNNYWNANKRDKAEEFYRGSLRINPNYTDAIIKLASLLSTQEKNEECNVLVNRALSLNPTNADILYNCATILMNIGKINKAITIYEQALTLNPSHHDSMIGLAKVYRKLEKNDKAEELLKKSLSVEPKAKVYQSLGGLYFNTGRLRESYQMFIVAFQMEPQDLDIVCSYAQVCNALDKSEDLYRMTTLFPETYCTNFNLAIMLAKQSLLLQEALFYSSKAITVAQLKREIFDAYTLHATILKDLKRLNEAALNYEKASTVLPEVVSSWINLGAVMHLMGNYSQAEVYYMKAQTLDPTNTIIQGNLKKLQRQRNTTSQKPN